MTKKHKVTTQLVGLQCCMGKCKNMVEITPPLHIPKGELPNVEVICDKCEAAIDRAIMRQMEWEEQMLDGLDFDEFGRPYIIPKIDYSYENDLKGVHDDYYHRNYIRYVIRKYLRLGETYKQAYTKAKIGWNRCAKRMKEEGYEDPESVVHYENDVYQSM